MVSGNGANRDRTVELISMWVAPFARGRGVGDALVAALIDSARVQDVRKIFLDVVASNERAEALYRRNRFVDVELVDRTRQGCERRMVLELRT